MIHRLNELMLVPPYCLQIRHADSNGSSTRIHAANVNLSGRRSGESGTSMRSSVPSSSNACPLAPGENAAPPSNRPWWAARVTPSAVSSPGDQAMTPSGSGSRGDWAVTAPIASTVIASAVKLRMVSPTGLWAPPGSRLETRFSGVAAVCHPMRGRAARTVTNGCGFPQPPEQATVRGAPEESLPQLPALGKKARTR